MTNHEGSVVISCATSLELGLIQPCRVLDVVPEKDSLIYSKADLVKQKHKKITPVNKLSDIVNSSKMQSHTVSRVQETEAIQCMNKKVETKSKQQQCQAPIPTVFNDKNCQAEKVSICSQRCLKWICSQRNQQNNLISRTNIHLYVSEDFSSCFSNVVSDFLMNKINFVGADKLLPVFKHGFLRSEENELRKPCLKTGKSLSPPTKLILFMRKSLTTYTFI